MKIPLLILVIFAICGLVLVFLGKRGLSQVLTFAGVLLLKDAIGHFCGELAEDIFVGLFVAVCIVIYILQRRKRSQHAEHKHHTEISDDHVA